MKQITNAVNSRINRLSSSKKVLDENKIIYYKALNNSEFQHELEYANIMNVNITEWSNIMNRNNSIRNSRNRSGDVNNNNNINKSYRNQKRKIIWFKLPFGELYTINIRKYFLNLINKHLHHENPIEIP